MTRKTNTMLIGLLGTILLGLGTWIGWRSNVF